METYTWPEYPSEVDGRLVSKWRGPIFRICHTDDSTSLDDAVVMGLNSRIVAHANWFLPNEATPVEFPKEFRIRGYEDIHLEVAEGQLVDLVLNIWDNQCGFQSPRPTRENKGCVVRDMLAAEKVFVNCLTRHYLYGLGVAARQLLEVIVPVELWIQAHPNWMVPPQET